MSAYNLPHFGYRGVRDIYLYLEFAIFANLLVALSKLSLTNGPQIAGQHDFAIIPA